ncbi:Arm DNA-binding domain-containing protein [Kingella kingae]|uniref:Arm DNA-binding domain-containing protein n=1 Tax=Kingella kingae TaxID=504 RepID=UPI001E5A9BA8|nr:Arm DNA-binding domain-containing protein [Kingella kingae]
MYLLVKPNGGKYWRLDYTIYGNMRYTLAISTYPTITLSQAREIAMNARKHLANGISSQPSQAYTAPCRGLCSATKHLSGEALCNG